MFHFIPVLSQCMVSNTVVQTANTAINSEVTSVDQRVEPSRVQGQSPSSGAQGGKAPLKLKSFWTFNGSGKFAHFCRFPKDKYLRSTWASRVCRRWGGQIPPPLMQLEAHDHLPHQAAVFSCSAVWKQILPLNIRHNWGFLPPNVAYSWEGNFQTG